MLRQRSVLLLVLLLLSAVLAAVANILGGLAADRVPLYLKANAWLLFFIAFVVEFVVGLALGRLQKSERRPLRLVLISLLIAVGAGSAALGGVVSNLVAATLPQDIRPYVVPNALPLLVAVTILTVLVEVGAYMLSAVPRLTPDNRRAFLSKVGERYTNRLRDTLGEAARIDLHLREDARAITQPALARQELGGGQEEQLLPVGTPISSVYDEAQEELLILGEPGSGKTTLVVELAVALVGRAKKSKQLRMPVIFSLASWAVKPQPLAKWMAEELYETYQVPPKVAAAWMEADEILPLLDGLDEVAEEHRTACAKAIDDYHREHDRVPLVVCSRSTEYFALPTRLYLHTAVVVQPLTDEHIEDYLKHGKGLAGLRDALAADDKLRSATRTPLILSVMALAYRGMASDAIPRIGDEKAWRRRLFDDYVPRVYHRQRGKSELGKQEVGRNRGRRPRGTAAGPPYTLEQTIHYLSWLAAQMKVRGQSDFYLERMQWDWLPDEQARERPPIKLVGSMRWSRRGLVDVLDAGLIFGLIGGLVFGLIGGLLAGLLAGLLGNGLATQQVDERDLRRPGEGIERSRRINLIYWLVDWLIVWPIFGLIGGLVGALVFGLVGGLVDGLVGGLIYGLIRGQGLDVILEPGQRRSVELYQRLAVGLVGGLVNGLVGGLAVGLVFGLIYGLIRGLLAGLGGALLAGLLAGLAVGLLAGLLAGLDSSQYSPHQELQRQLERTGVVPRGYVHFLDFAAEHVLLQRIGGGYRFIHALLLDYFADRWGELGKVPHTTEMGGTVVEQVQTGKTPKCTFSGVVSIEPQRFLDSGVTLVECPNCARTRSLSPSKGVLRFPSHDKRKTKVPVTSKRWAMRETIWKVVGG